MKPRRLSIALSIAIATMLAESHVASAAPGGVRSLSAVGEPFQAEILIAEKELADAAACLRLAPAAGAPQWLEEARIEAVGRGALARIVISSPQVVLDPVLSLTIENLCNPAARSEYTLVLPGLAPLPAPLGAARAQQEAVSSSRPRLRVHTDEEVFSRSQQNPDEAALQARGVRGGQQLPDRLSEREQEVSAALQRTIAAESALLARIRELEARQAVLERHVRTLGLMPAAGAASPAATTAPGPQEEAAVAPQLQAQITRPAAAPTVDPGRHRLHVAGNVVLGALLAIALAAIALLLRRARHTPPVPAPSATAPETTPETRTTSPAAAAATTRSPAPDPVAAAPAARNTQAPQTERPAEDPTPSDLPVQLGLDAADEHKSAVELADIMLSFGRIHGAAATLAEFIKNNPKEAVTPWLKLLDLYHTAGLKTEFENWARQLHKAFNIRRATWDSYQSLRNSTASVEDLPHIAKRLQTLWRTPACQAYIEELLRDHRDGSREGFSFAVVEDLLMLEGVLEAQLGEFRRQPSAGDTRR